MPLSLAIENILVKDYFIYLQMKINGINDDSENNIFKKNQISEGSSMTQAMSRYVEPIPVIQTQ